MQYTVDELSILTRAYLSATGISVSRLGHAVADNSKLFVRILRGDDCLSRSAELASRWFEKNWPLHVGWPENLPPPPPPVAEIKVRDFIRQRRLEAEAREPGEQNSGAAAEEEPPAGNGRPRRHRRIKLAG